MAHQAGILVKGSAANFTLVRPFAGVQPPMNYEARFQVKSLVAFRAFVGSRAFTVDVTLEVLREV